MSQLERRDDAATSVVDAFLQAVGDAVLRMGRLLINRSCGPLGRRCRGRGRAARVGPAGLRPGGHSRASERGDRWFLRPRSCNRTPGAL